MPLVGRSSIAIAALLLYCFVWLFDPQYFGVLGSEGLLRWGALVALALVALMFRETFAFLPTITMLTQLVFMAALLLSVALADASSSSGYLEVLRLAPTCLVAPIVVGIYNSGERDRLGRWLIGLLAAVSLGSILVGTFGGRMIGGRLFGITWHPNTLALASSILCAIAFLAGRRIGVASLLLFGLGAWTVFLTESLIGGLIVAAVVVATVLQRWISARLGVLWLIAFGVAGLLTPLAVAASATDYLSLYRIVDASSFERLGIWSNSLRAFVTHPVLGTGFAASQSIYDLGSASSYYYSHSLVLNYLRTTGIIGLAAIVLLLLKVTSMSVENSRRGSMLAMSILFPVLMFSTVEAGLQQMPISWVMFWLAAGVSLATARSATMERQTVSRAGGAVPA